VPSVTSALEMSCGDRSVTVPKEQGVYVIEQIDNVRQLQGCACTCAYDFSATIDLSQEQASKVSIKVVRAVEEFIYAPQDQPKPTFPIKRSDVFKGELELSTERGSSVVDKTPLFGCTEK
jgi:hypothetical protein